MALAVKGAGNCSGSTCTVPLGAAFTLAVEVVTAPSQGYVLAQSYVDFGPDLNYNPSAAPLDEFSWPECTPASLPVRGQLDDESIISGCLTGILTRPVSNYVGNYVKLFYELLGRCEQHVGPTTTSRRPSRSHQRSAV